jgi:hypothetical protein
MCSSKVGRKKKTTDVQGNNYLVAIYPLQCGKDRKCVAAIHLVGTKIKKTKSLKN